MKKSYNKAFTLVELLAVIVILAIILVIAVPKIMDVINSSKKSTLETSVKMIASAAEKTKMQNTVLGKEDATITCDSVAKLSSSDYANCTIKFDGNTAKVTVKGKGKFEGLSVCGGTKSQATTQKEECVNNYFTYEFKYDYKLTDKAQCLSYVKNNLENCNWWDDTTLENWWCSEDGMSFYEKGNEESGFEKEVSTSEIIITDYNMEGGTEVVIPSTIDGYTVVGVKFYDDKFNGITKITVPDTVLEKYSFYYDPVNEMYVGAIEGNSGNCPPPE